MELYYIFNFMLLLRYYTKQILLKLLDSAAHNCPPYVLIICGNVLPIFELLAMHYCVIHELLCF
jgi:hypothetical protein